MIRKIEEMILKPKILHYLSGFPNNMPSLMIIIECEAKNPKIMDVPNVP